METGGQRHTWAASLQGKRPGTHITGGLVGPRAGLNGCGKFRLRRDSIPGFPSPERVAIQTDLPGPIQFSVRKKMFICCTIFGSVLGHVKSNIQLLMVTELSSHEGNQKFSPGAKLEMLGSVSS